MSVIESAALERVQQEGLSDVPTAAHFLKIPPSTLWMHIRAGRVQVIRLGKHVRISAATLRKIEQEGLQ